MAGLNGNKYELTQAQLQALKDEIINDPQGEGYAGKTRGGVSKLLNDKPLIDNPDAQKQIKAPPIGKDWLLAVIPAAKLESEIKAIRADASGIFVWELMMGMATIHLNNPLFDKFWNMLKTKGIISQETYAAIQAKKTIPDPSYQAQIPGQSRAEELLLAGIMIEGVDVEAALAL